MCDNIMLVISGAIGRRACFKRSICCSFSRLFNHSKLSLAVDIFSCKYKAVCQNKVKDFSASLKSDSKQRISSFIAKRSMTRPNVFDFRELSQKLVVHRDGILMFCVLWYSSNKGLYNSLDIAVKNETFYCQSQVKHRSVPAVFDVHSVLHE